ncbi:MAG: chemotaxis protein CheB [Ignavibacteria bacterium]|nr:chemotaxis protein CheB [Ignavibacteria bacterium]
MKTKQGKKRESEKSPVSNVSKARGTQDSSFPIIGVGASAGGLEAFEQFFRHVPPDNGMAFVLVPHLDPRHASMLTEILQRVAAMPVVEVQDRMAVAPNRVHVIPPNRDMAIFHGALQLSVPEGSRGQRMPIDSFLRSLAEEQGEKAIGVILSGTGTDGTLGLRAILGAGGVSFVQDPSTAKYDGMPTSAVQSGLATYVLPAEKMPEQLLTYVKTLFEQKKKPASAAPAATSALRKIMLLLRSKTGHDFTLYKQSTICRRIERRMAVHSIEDTDIYARYLQEHPGEVQLLFKELLINVTSFFRDAEAFDVLKKDILPQLFEHKPEGYTFRIWGPGCATGEEAYSLAIIFREHMDDTGQEFKVQIYGTDIDEDEVATARSGIYPPNIVTDVSPERVRRFFVREGTGYQVRKDIREMVIYATQNVIKDPPFTKLDLVSCRNLLIYLGPELQSRLIPTFHYALKTGGVLFLSPSESVGNFTDLFKPINKKCKFFEAKKPIASTRTLMAGGLPWIGNRIERGLDKAVNKAEETNFAELAKRVLLESYAPPSVVTDEKGNILYVHGDTGKYLRPAPGQASLNIVEMSLEGLQLELRTAIHNAAMKKTRVTCKDLPVKTDGGIRGVNLTVNPLTEPEAIPGLLIVSFQEAEPQPQGKTTRAKRPAGSGSSERVEKLKQELVYAKENLQATIEELQAANEELKSTNEEFQSTNEELQSTNEELQSLNEELVTVNAELQAKIEQLAEMQNDMKNLLDNTNIGTIFLDENLAIKWFNRDAATVFRLAATDTGRPLSDIKSNIEGEDLIVEARAVLDSLVPREKQVRKTGNEWCLVRIVPYRTLDNVIEGIVLTFTDITGLKRTEKVCQEAREYAESIVDTIREPLIVLNGDLKVVSASRSFYRYFHVTPEETVGSSLYNLADRQWDIPRLRELLETILPKNTSFDDFEMEHTFRVIGRREMVLNARRISGNTGETQLILLAMEDVTDRRLLACLPARPAGEPDGQE